MHDLPIRSALLLLSVLSLFGLQYAVSCHYLRKDILHSGARGFGLLMSSAGVGAVLGALHFAARDGLQRLARSMAVTSMTCAIGLEVFAAIASFLAILGGAADRGICSNVSNDSDEHAYSEPGAG